MHLTLAYNALLGSIPRNLFLATSILGNRVAVLDVATLMTDKVEAVRLRSAHDLIASI